MLKIKGNKTLTGEVQISGSKNASLALIVASLLNKEEVVLKNVPNILDVNILLNILRYLNVIIEYKNNELYINSKNIEYKTLAIDDVKKIRGSSYLMGAFLSLFKKVEIYNPGGCAFSNRPIDYHLEAFEIFGSNVSYYENKILITLDKEVNGYYHIPQISVGTTIDILIFASLLENTIILDNIANEPEVHEVINFLILLGVEIVKIKEKTLFVKGNKSLKNRITYTLKNDRIEAQTFALIGASIGENLIIKGFDIFDNLYLLNIFIKLKVPFNIQEDTLIISKIKDFEGLELETNPFPLLPTDIQPLLCVFLSLGRSKSTIEELIYPTRLSHVYELQKLGFNLDINNNYIIIKPINKLIGNIVTGKDLRGTFSLVIGALLVDDIVYINNEHFIYRGYENVIDKLKNLGADISEEKDGVL